MPSGYRISQLMSTIYDGTSRNAISGGRVGSALPTSVTDAWKPQSPRKLNYLSYYTASLSKELGNLDEGDVAFIKELIHPPEDKYDTVRDGEDEEKKKNFFLYEIVANETYGVDVDKWDYFARDSLYLGVKNSFDHDRLIASARACLDKNGVSHVTYRDKDVDTLYEMFHIRFTLYRKAYLHRVSKAIEMMIGDAMDFAEDIKVKGDDGRPKRIHEAVDDMSAYIKLNDDILHKIAESSSKAARTLVSRIFTRDIYTHLGEKTITNDMKEQDVVKEILGTENEEKELQKNLGVDIASYDYGNKDKNPVLNAYFYTKNDKTAKKLEERALGRRMMVPMQFNEKVARMFCKDPKYEETLKEKTKVWCNIKKLAEQQSNKCVEDNSAFLIIQ
ncbi:deoxynucleoside triphosphate triphosphohydrolase SAMHD1-like [Pecten maximus]|uniref:deoxynucleoside triphosphate triphosphohydrolase SAMHD1-like n=1 Tax=Pecten maximus TaxID=6579 RepID=UPI001459012F|nr:deoxynucleoside triphosphate triphosphohydrolase SAMHD1-like [Pecten maximus]